MRTRGIRESNYMQKFKTWYLRRKAKRKLVKQYEYLVEVNTLLEEYITSKILQGGSAKFIEDGRKNLIQKQGEIRENKAFLEFLAQAK
jgi:hypothetical protein